MRKIIVTHRSPDLDAITSVWLLKSFAPGWENADVHFVPAGQKLHGNYSHEGEVIERVDDNEVIHVDTGLTPLDHHQTQDNNTCAASLTFEYVKSLKNSPINSETKLEALEKMIQLAIDEDHFQEIYYKDSLSYLYDFSITRIIDGYKLLYQKDDLACLEFTMTCLDTILHSLEQKMWAEHEIAEKGIQFDTRWGKACAIESMNDMVLEVAQKKGKVIAVRKDPKYGFIRIKARPLKRESNSGTYATETVNVENIDLTPVYEKIKKLDPDSTWYLHVSKKMLLNGSSKNPEMAGSKLTLSQVIEVLKEI